MINDRILSEVDKYYSDKIKNFGATPKGVDWNSSESQNLRFDQLSKVITTEKFSILDFGCGYGAYYQYLQLKAPAPFEYTGFDISADMLDSASKQNKEAKWILELDKNTRYNYVIASGIFNVKLSFEKDSWIDYILSTLNQMNDSSTDGFSLNMLTKYSDAEYMKDYLYYADPLYFFDYCKKNFSRNVALLHDYNLYEFTLIIRK